MSFPSLIPSWGCGIVWLWSLLLALCESTILVTRGLVPQSPLTLLSHLCTYSAVSICFSPNSSMCTVFREFGSLELRELGMPMGWCPPWWPGISNPLIGVWESSFFALRQRWTQRHCLPSKALCRVRLKPLWDFPDILHRLAFLPSKPPLLLPCYFPWETSSIISDWPMDPHRRSDSGRACIRHLGFKTGSRSGRLSG